MRLNKEINASELQRRVQIACVVRNTSIVELAEQFGTSRQSLYSAIHTGEIGIKRLLKLADALEVSVDWLLGYMPLNIEGFESHV